ncbi:RluA family pseudouridine synthase [Ulvibacter litoralis]|uniref:23S rRNA pseudouridine1911/1915/1917 synthase n=1 Tax=Ulvibacter litoralis TaxID=227084 RepID=A0A1G7FT21_9FLAO|nr:RluA family pseudouridine synthase [Ulvibacter litoralis]GHC63594.1 pseudouridine synthase [Ulvibacter litoralis]SDE79044.1 23S rRNA pseudouridine1911/1915/1917 synthase [Ulvibacter litoralis]
MILKETHTVPNQEAPVRFQEYGISIFTSVTTKSGLKKLIKKQVITIDTVPATTATYIKGGETICLFEAETPLKASNLVFPLEVCYEDEHLAIINKPAGILVSGNKHKTIVNALPSNLSKSNEVDALSHPKPVHRLDFPTSGLLLIAKTNTALVALNKLFEEKQISKIYHAITTGALPKEGTIETPIADKASHTRYKVLDTKTLANDTLLNLVALYPSTGRRHQLRIHVASLGSPILGDATYNLKEQELKGRGLYLQATSLQFTHPITSEEVTISIGLHKKFQKLFQK